VRIAYVVTRMIIGGAQETAKYTAETLRARGYDVVLITGEEAGREGHYQVRVPTITVPSLVRDVRPARDLRALVALYRIFRARKPDIVHARTAKARFLAPLAARLAGVRVIVQTVHGWSFNNQIDKRRRVYVWAERLAARLCDCSVMVSEIDLDEGYRLGILDSRRAVVIRSGVDVARFAAEQTEDINELRRQLASDDELLVTLVGRLSPPKTPEVFIAAAAQVSARKSDVKFLVVGDGQKRESVKQLISNCGLEQRVMMLGLREDVPRIMAASDIIAHSSADEGLPKTILEGMAAGKPVIGTNVGGVPIVIEHGVSGLLVNKHDPEALAWAIERLLEDRSLRERLALEAARRLPVFSLDKTVADTEHLYAALCSRGDRLAEATQFSG
jgi:glycosyltransferase involved in cell wall biosynthesis